MVIRHRKWTASEVESLRVALLELGLSVDEAATMVRTRTAAQCRGEALRRGWIALSFRNNTLTKMSFEQAAVFNDAVQRLRAGVPLARVCRMVRIKYRDIHHKA